MLIVGVPKSPPTIEGAGVKSVRVGRSTSPQSSALLSVNDTLETASKKVLWSLSYTTMHPTSVDFFDEDCGVMVTSDTIALNSTTSST